MFLEADRNAIKPHVSSLSCWYSFII